MSRKGVEVMDPAYEYDTIQIWFVDAFYHEPSEVLTLLTAEGWPDYQFHLKEGTYTSVFLYDMVVERAKRAAKHDEFTYKRKRFRKLTESEVYAITESVNWIWAVE